MQSLLLVKTLRIVLASIAIVTFVNITVVKDLSYLTFSLLFFVKC